MKIVTYAKTDPHFDTVMGLIQVRLKARLAGCLDLCSPTQTPLLKQADFSEFLCRTENPVDFKFLSFGFKKNKDPANLYPLRYIRGVTAKMQQFYVGSDSKNADTGSQQELNLGEIKKIEKITTFFASPKEAQGAKQDRYKRRIIAFVITYTGIDNDSHEQLICSPSSEFYSIRQKYPDAIRANCLDYLNTYAKNNPTYYIAYEENAGGLNFYPDPAAPTKPIQITNVAYDAVNGASKDYIANLALISTVSIDPAELLPPAVETVTFQIPFRKNTTGNEIKLESESSASSSYRSVVATQKTHNFSIGIPNISVKVPGGPSVAIGKIAGYTYGSSHGQTVEENTGSASTSKVSQTIPADAYVLEDFQHSKDFEATAKIQMFNAASKEVMEVSVPTNVPCFSVADDDALAEAIVDSI